MFKRSVQIFETAFTNKNKQQQQQIDCFTSYFEHRIEFTKCVLQSREVGNKTANATSARELNKEKNSTKNHKFNCPSHLSFPIG